MNDDRFIIFMLALAVLAVGIGLVCFHLVKDCGAP